MKSSNSTIDLLVALAICVAGGDEKSARTILSMRQLVSVKKKVMETILEVHLFAGFPATIDGMFLYCEVFGRNGLVNAGRRTSNTRQRRKLGNELSQKIYGDHHGKLILNMKQLHPDLAKWIVEYGYGEVLARPGLSLKERELIAIGVLASGGWTRQLRSHIRGALNIGILPEELRHLGDLLFRIIPQGRAEKYRQLLDESLETPRKRKST